MYSDAMLYSAWIPYVFSIWHGPKRARKGLVQPQAWHAGMRGSRSGTRAASHAFERMHTHASIWSKHGVSAAVKQRGIEYKYKSWNAPTTTITIRSEYTSPSGMCACAQKTDAAARVTLARSPWWAHATTNNHTASLGERGRRHREPSRLT